MAAATATASLGDAIIQWLDSVRVTTQGVVCTARAQHVDTLIHTRTAIIGTHTDRERLATPKTPKLSLCWPLSLGAQEIQVQ